MQSPRQSAYALLGALAVIASTGCDQPRGASRNAGNNRPLTREEAYSRQVTLDVAAIVVGVARAHGAEVVALMPER